MTKVVLAEKASINTKRLYTFESGRAIPTADELESIAFVLNFPVSFFSRPDIDVPHLGTASFRSMKSMSAAERDAALAAGSLAFELSKWIDDRFELPAPNLPDLHNFHPAQAAIALRAFWKIGDRPIGNMIRLLEANGVRVFSLSEQCRRLDAFSLWYRDTPFVFLNTLKTAEHNRMDAAHELGHLVMHRDRHSVPRGRDIEQDAQSFAGGFLMPEDSVRGIVRRQSPTPSQMIELKKYWRVSAAALAYRLHELRLLSDWNYRSICIQLSEYGRTREPEGMSREASAVLVKVFTEMWRSGVAKADIAKHLDIYLSDLESMIFGLSVVPAPDGSPSSDAEAQDFRMKFRVV